MAIAGIGLSGIVSASVFMERVHLLTSSFYLSKNTATCEETSFSVSESSLVDCRFGVLRSAVGRVPNTEQKRTRMLRYHQ